VSARWYKRCGADFIHGTMMLTLEEKGAYSLCLDLIYDRGGPIPDDARWLSGVCGVSMRKWSALRDRLVSLGKLTASDGLLSNLRADFELVSAELSSRKLAEAGAKGGRKRAENAGEPKQINGIAQAGLKPKEKIREEEKVEGTTVPVISSEMTHPVDSKPELKVEHVVEAWNATAEQLGLKAVRKLTPERRRKVATRIRQNTVDEFTEAIGAIGRSAFLRGDNDRAWKADFDWMLEPRNFTKLIEGTYDR
jgi:uncharacterized protein YdaU (DUF1376 family)